MRTQASSDAISGATEEFISPFEGPYMISKVISLSTIEVCDSNSEINLLKPSGFFTYHQVENPKLLHGARFTFIVLY
jgi:hypothetical protein